MGDESHNSQVDDDESVDKLFREIWERESQPELRFQVPGVGEVIQAQDLNGHRWQVHNFSNTVWEAAIWMHHFFQDQRCFPPGWLRGCRVLEVGAGTGLVGLTLALLGAEVTMTDLEEALPILRHNTDVTFGHALGANDNDRVDDYGGNNTAVRKGFEKARMPVTPGTAKKPTIRKLCWGNAADAEEVAQAAAGHAGELRGEGSRWNGFDVIVGADVIYNETTFPALLATLSHSHLCSDTTIIYLATRLRGGRHEGFLEQLAETFHVCALGHPTSANDFRAHLNAGLTAPCDEEGRILQSRRDRGYRGGNTRTISDSTGCLHAAAECAESRYCCDGSGGREDNGAVDTNNENDDFATSVKCDTNAEYCCRSNSYADRSSHNGDTTTCEAPDMAVEGELGGVVGANILKKPTGRACRKHEEDVQNQEWSYGERDLGQVLAFAAHRKRA